VVAQGCAECLGNYCGCIVRAGLLRCADGVQGHKVSLGTFPLPGARIVDINRGPSMKVMKVRSSRLAEE